jgi:hypothetical protein
MEINMLPTKKWQSSNGPQSNLQFNVFVGTTAIRRTPVRRTPVCRTFENRQFVEPQFVEPQFIKILQHRTPLCRTIFFVELFFCRTIF